MEYRKIIPSPINTKGRSITMNSINLFAEKSFTYLNEFNLFLAYFNAVPNFIDEINFDCKKANEWFLENYKSEIKAFHYNKRYFHRNRTAQYDDLFYILYDDLIVYFDTCASTARFLFCKTDISKIETIIDGLKRFKEKRYSHQSKMSLLISTRQGIETKSLRITKPWLSIDDN